MQSGQTPREFATQVSQALGGQPGTEGVKRIMEWVVEVYYRQRYGHRNLTPDELSDLTGKIDQLEKTLGGSYTLHSPK